MITHSAHLHHLSNAFLQINCSGRDDDEGRLVVEGDGHCFAHTSMHTVNYIFGTDSVYFVSPFYRRRWSRITASVLDCCAEVVSTTATNARLLLPLRPSAPSAAPPYTYTYACSVIVSHRVSRAPSSHTRIHHISIDTLIHSLTHTHTRNTIALH
jgi:hypothetical protein